MFNYIINFILGLILFYYGINSLNNLLKNNNTDKIKNIILYKSNQFINIIKGIISTIIIQSSSFLTVLLVNLVNNNIISYDNSIDIIMGSNIGTCFTGIILANIINKPNNYLLGLLSLIVIIYFVFKRYLKMNFVIYLIIIFLGMNYMNSSSLFLNNFNINYKYLNNPLIGIFLGIILTIIFQSSSLIIGLLIIINKTSTLNILTVINLIIGSNIGTCSTSFLASINMNMNAKRVSKFHISFNIIGGILFILLFLIISIFYKNILYIKINSYTIPIINIILNVFSTIVFIPLKKRKIKFFF